MNSLLFPENDTFWEKDRNIFYYQGDDGRKVGGYYKTRGKFTLLTAPKSGHFIPADNYHASLAYLDDLVHHGGLKCIGKVGKFG